MLVQQPQTLRRMRYLMGCLMEVEVQGLEKQAATLALENAFAEIKRIEAMLSKFQETSIVSQINREASLSPLKISSEVFELLKSAQEFSEQTEGAFDLTTGPLSELWSFAEKRGSEPSQEELSAVLNQIGHNHIQLDLNSQSVFLMRPNMKLDFGAIGKGYAIDCAAKLLREQGVLRGVIYAGSTIFVWGDEPVSFGIQSPHYADDTISTVTLMNQAVSTSAQNEQFWMIGGKKYGHIVNPRSGYSVKNDLSSVSIVASSAMASDIFTTAFFVMGKKKCADFLTQSPALKAILV